MYKKKLTGLKKIDYPLRFQEQVKMVGDKQTFQSTKFYILKNCWQPWKHSDNYFHDFNPWSNLLSNFSFIYQIF